MPLPRTAKTEAVHCQLRHGEDFFPTINSFITSFFPKKKKKISPEISAPIIDIISILPKNKVQFQSSSLKKIGSTAEKKRKGRPDHKARLHLREEKKKNPTKTIRNFRTPHLTHQLPPTHQSSNLKLDSLLPHLQFPTTLPQLPNHPCASGSYTCPYPGAADGWRVPSPPLPLPP